MSRRTCGRRWSTGRDRCCGTSRWSPGTSRRLPVDEPGADHDVLRRDRRRAVIDAMAQLPRRQREVLALRYYLDLSEREIAETLGISPGAVKSHASRGTEALRRTLSTHLEETP